MIFTPDPIRQRRKEIASEYKDRPLNEAEAGAHLIQADPVSALAISFSATASYGRLSMHNGRLRLECNSRRRLETGSRLIESIAGAWLQHQGDSFQSQQSIKREAFEKKPGRRPAKEPELPPDLEREIIAKFNRKHYADWVDQPIPALDGLTPRQAARSKSKRRQLEDLLRTMENREARERAEGHAAFDFSTIRKQLGM